MSKRIITISREFGSGGRFIGEETARKLGIAYYDKEIITQIAENSGLSSEFIAEKAELSPKKGFFSYAFIGRDMSGKSLEDIIYEEQRKIILSIAEKESCVIIGRNADFILKDRDDVINVFIHGNIPQKTERICHIYQADDFKQNEMNAESEKFRKITMKVLTMQLNSITIMDLIAYGGAALGVILSVTQYRAGHVSLAGCLLIILLSADFFIPMRMLGSFFHIAMNGIAASDKIFRLLDMPEHPAASETIGEDCTLVCTKLRFSYEKEREILHGLDMCFPKGSFTAIVGESGCGKSTISSVLTGRSKGYEGKVTIGGKELKQIDEESLMETITYISHHSYLFKGTVRDNLLMGCPTASDEELWEVLDRVNLLEFLKSEKGLDTKLNEKASNLSGGQCQRLALARALLHDSPVYIFDEATSNIDVESENDIMSVIHGLAGSKTVILISHRLANVTASDNIYVMEKGNIAEIGKHEELLNNNGMYAKLWNTQQNLENYGKEGAIA